MGAYDQLSTSNPNHWEWKLIFKGLYRSGILHWRTILHILALLKASNGEIPYMGEGLKQEVVVHLDHVNDFLLGSSHRFQLVVKQAEKGVSLRIVRALSARDLDVIEFCKQFRAKEKYVPVFHTDAFVYSYREWKKAKKLAKTKQGEI